MLCLAQSMVIMMAGKFTLAESFAQFGAIPRNPRWSWSARSSDGKTVVIALWSDRFRWKDKPLSYDGREQSIPQDWTGRPGNRERLDNLLWARANCEGLFRVVMVRPVDRVARPREIEECFPKDGWLMRIIDLNEITGEFQAILVEGA